MQTNYSYNDEGVRFNHIQQSNNDDALNWLFIPGGPGADSRYLQTLTTNLKLPGNIILVDMPGNGDNDVKQPYDYSNWFKLFVPMVKSFKHPIIVGHSFGAMMPMLLPELDEIVEGFVILNSSPCLWQEASAKAMQQSNISDTAEKKAFIAKPTQETFKQAMMAQVPHLFAPEAIPKGKAMFEHLPYPLPVVQAMHGLLRKRSYHAAWVPQHIPTLIVCGNDDFIHPPSLFAKDKRFDRPNIQQFFIDGAGHWSWIEKPNEVAKLFKNFYTKLN